MCIKKVISDYVAIKDLLFLIQKSRKSNIIVKEKILDKSDTGISL